MGQIIQEAYCDLCRLPAGFRLLPHVHPDLHELYLITRGAACANIEDEERHIGQVGDILHHPLGRTHFPEEVAGEPLEFLHLRWKGGDDLMTRWRANPTHDHNGHMRHLLEWMLDLESAEATGAPDNPLKCSLVEALLREGLRLQEESTSPLVEAVSRFVRTRLTESLSLDSLAKCVNMSVYHFSRRFRRESGRTPMQFVAEMRVQSAKQLLLRTDMTVAAIAESVGLNDAAHFSHVFKRQTGHSPGSFRSNGS